MKDMGQGGNAAQLNGSDTVSGNTWQENGTPQPGADMQGADMQGADMQGADMQGADMQGVDMQGAGDMPENTGEVEVPVKKSEKKRLFIIAAVVAVIALIIGISFFSNGKDKRLQEQLDLGAKYIDELEYEQALACYLSAVEIDPMSVDAYLGIIEVYIRTGEYDLALEWAEKGYELTGDEQLAEKAEMIRSGNISRWDGQPVKVTCFDADGHVSWWHEYTYDKESRQDSISHYGADGNLIKTLPVTYDEEGNTLEGYGYVSDTGELFRMVYTYEDGVRVTAAEYGSDDTTIEYWFVYENNEEGKKIRSTEGHGSHIGDEAEISGYRESEYDENGNEIKESGYDTDYNLDWYVTWEYDEAGKLQKYSHYDADGSLSRYITYEYDEEGKVKSTKHYNGSGELEYEDTYE